MILLRHLAPPCVRLGLHTVPEEPREDETEAQGRNRRERDKERLLHELVGLLSESGHVANQNKLFKDLLHRERKATTGIAPGIAIPHVRTMQVRHFTIALARAEPPGIWFDALDGEPTRLFLVLASPTYEDRLYLQVYREFAQLALDEDFMAEFFAAGTTQDVFNALRRRFQ